MELSINFYYNEKFLPTARCRKEKKRTIKGSVNVNINELEEKDFPVAFRVTENKSVYENAKNYDDFDDDKDLGYISHTEEIRTDGKHLYTPMRITHGAAISTLFLPLSEFKDTLEWVAKRAIFNSYIDNSDEYTEKSVKVSDNSEEIITFITNKTKDYVIWNGVVWERRGEPYYYVTTFGCGKNHGGTGFFIGYGESDYGFSALEREKAVAYGKKVALDRGDTESVIGIGEYENIEVVMPEMVKFKKGKQ